MSDNSPCFPVRRVIHQPNLFHPNGTYRSLKTLENQSPRLTFRERIPAAGTSDASHKVAGIKRKASEDDFDISMGESPTSPKEGHYYNYDMETNSHKRTKTGNAKEFPLSKLLATLDKQQLLTLISNIVDAHPNLQYEIASNIPRPTIQSVTTVLNSLEKKVYESFPYTKWGVGKDDYSFNRVKPAIQELKDIILDYAAHFASPDEFPTNTFSFLHLATNVTHRLPNWENSLHNEIKRDLLVKLADYWKKAIENAANKIGEGKIYGQTVVSEWARNLAQHNHDSNGTFQQAIDAFVNKLGWIIGIADASLNPSSTQNIPVHYHSNPVKPV